MCAVCNVGVVKQRAHCARDARLTATYNNMGSKTAFATKHTLGFIEGRDARGLKRTPDAYLKLETRIVPLFILADEPPTTRIDAARRMIALA